MVALRKAINSRQEINDYSSDMVVMRLFCKMPCREQATPLLRGIAGDTGLFSKFDVSSEMGCADKNPLFVALTRK